MPSWQDPASLPWLLLHPPVWVRGKNVHKVCVPYPLPGPSSSATNPASSGPGSRPHLHLQQLLLHQPLQRLLLVRFQVVAARVSQEPPPHDGVRERAAETCVKTESPPRPCPFQPQRQPLVHLRSGRPRKKPRMNSCISFSRAILLHLGLVAPAFFSLRPPSPRLTGACALAGSWRREGRDRWGSVAGRLDRELCQTKLACLRQLEGFAAPPLGSVVL